MSRRHTCFVAVLICIPASLTYAEPPVLSGNGGNPIVSQRLLNRVADILANNGDSSSRGDDGTQRLEGPSIVNQELLDRIARIISQNDGQLSWAHKSHSKSADESAQPSGDLSLPRDSNNEISQEYGVSPTKVPETAKELAGPQFQLSPPEPVPRIASFDWRDEDENGPPSDTYSDSRNLYQGSEKLQLSQAQSAVRIASFNIEGEQAPGPYTPPQQRGGYFTNH